MLKQEYEHHTTITKELLDSIKVGDLIKVNDWKKPLRVKGVSENYFVMSTKTFGKTDYSVCEKKPWDGIRHNSMVGGMFHVGTDAWIFGSPVFKDGDYYNFENKELTYDYLKSFELSEMEEDHSFISHRTSVPIYNIFIKRTNILS